MKVFLCGGGDGAQAAEAYKRLNQAIDHSRPLLYVPLAMEPELYDSCYEWICNELQEVDIPHIDIVRSAEELSARNLSDYCVLFLGSGNTFKLLKDLKASGSYAHIRDYLENGGIAFGGSAGAIVFGKDLKACQLDDANEVGLKEISGFDVLGGISVLCHYTNRDTKKGLQSKQYLLELSKQVKVVALPEEVTLFMDDGKVEAIGDKPYYYFENGCVSIHTVPKIQGY